MPESSRTKETSSGSDVAVASSTQSQKMVRKRRDNIWLILLLLLQVAPYYFIGILWHVGLHPLVSVFTGKMEPRRWYIDENSLEPSYFRMDVPYDLLLSHHKKKLHHPAGTRRISSLSHLCQSRRSTTVADDDDDDIVSCHRHENLFELIRILPINGAVAPVTEALVVVVPPPDNTDNNNNWINSNNNSGGDQFHWSVMQLVRRLSTAPWLAKTVFLVTPIGNHTLNETVNLFLDSYLGERDVRPVPTGTRKYSSKKRNLPAKYTGAMLRNVIVLDVIQTESDNEVRILPQGRRGLLPNMDLTFLSMFVYSKSNMIARRHRPLVMHPYRKQAQELWSKWIQPNLDARLHGWAQQLIQLLCFEYTLAMGPYPPHASALDRGIDSLTIQGLLSGGKVETAEFVQRVEVMLRSLSNLHERLHHSTSLYLLISPERFVKHEEYLVPNLLLLIPLVIRAISLVLLEIKQFSWKTLQWALQWTLFGAMAGIFVVEAAPTLGISASERWAALLPLSDTLMACQVGLATLYIAVFVMAIRSYSSVTKSSYYYAPECIQFLACLWALIIHVPIAFGHVSLAFPSAVFWTPLIAFPSYKERKAEDHHHQTPRRHRRVFFILGCVWSVGLILVTLPCAFVVPLVFPTYTTYVKYGYMPLHVLLTLLHISKCMHGTMMT